jgi:hypothetical protein
MYYRANWGQLVGNSILSVARPHCQWTYNAKLYWSTHSVTTRATMKPKSWRASFNCIAFRSPPVPRSSRVSIINEWPKSRMYYRANRGQLVGNNTDTMCLLIHQKNTGDDQHTIRCSTTLPMNLIEDLGFSMHECVNKCVRLLSNILPFIFPPYHFCFIACKFVMIEDL